jgi:hypothetical protein
MERAGVDRLAALTQSVETVCRGGTISIIGVYGGTADPRNMLQLFDKGVKVAVGQAHVRRWIDDLMPLVSGDSDPLGVEDLCTHRLRLDEAQAPTRCFRGRRTARSRSCSSPESRLDHVVERLLGGSAGSRLGEVSEGRAGGVEPEGIHPQELVISPLGEPREVMGTEAVFA